MASINQSYATGAVSASQRSAGGLVGENYASINQSHATGLVSSLTQVGGLVGRNFGSSNQSYATGAVNGTFAVGGLVGENIGTSNNIGTNLENVGSISQSYATGAVNGTGAVGGLVGLNTGSIDNNGSINQSYSTGAVSSTGSVGGMVGQNNGSIASSYWDIQTSLLPFSNGGTGLTTAQLKSGLPTDFDPAVWALSPSLNSGYPHLQWQTATTPTTTVTTLTGAAPTVTTAPTVDQVLAATLASLTNQSSNISKSDTPPQNSQPNLIISNDALRKLREELAGVPAVPRTSPSQQSTSSTVTNQGAITYTAQQLASLATKTEGAIETGLPSTAFNNTTNGYCTDYAVGIFNAGTGKSLSVADFKAPGSPNADAGPQWLDKAPSLGLSVLKIPTNVTAGDITVILSTVPPGSIAVYRNTEGGAGHVAIVETNNPASQSMQLAEANWGRGYLPGTLPSDVKTTMYGSVGKNPLSYQSTGNTSSVVFRDGATYQLVGFILPSP